MEIKYDFLIVGAGLYGSVCARQLTDKGYNCLVIDKRDHIGGNCYTENINGINVHKYGAHIFHTSLDVVWEYINKYIKFNNFTNRVKVNYKDNIYSFPINLLTLYQLWNIKTPSDAQKILEEKKIKIENPKNLEEWVLSQVGEEIYEKFIKGYTKKQWCKEPSELPSEIIKRIPIRLNFNDNYFFDKYQGIPYNGYNELFEKLLYGIDVKLNTDYLENFHLKNSCDSIIYTGGLDRLFNFKFGNLEYRSMEFKSEILNIKDYQGCSCINYTDIDVPYIRIIEHKHYEFGEQDFTIITKEYPTDIGEPYYPINNDNNNEIYKLYLDYSKKDKNLYIGGRLGLYKYMDMDKVIFEALQFTEKIKQKNEKV